MWQPWEVEAPNWFGNDVRVSRELLCRGEGEKFLLCTNEIFLDFGLEWQPSLGRRPERQNDGCRGKELGINRGAFENHQHTRQEYKISIMASVRDNCHNKSYGGEIKTRYSDEMKIWLSMCFIKY